MRQFIISVMAGLFSTAAFAQDSLKDTTATDTIAAFQTQELKEVKVTARKKLVEQKIDKTVVNVDAFVTNAGTSALEVLEKSPGVQVDKDGNISLKGKQGVTILIDGRPTYLSGEQLANVLKGMESSQIDQIEIMTNPPAKYDAAGNSGVINIKTKKNKVKGFNGSITAGYGQGKYAKTNESVSLNYRAGKFNAFANYSFSRNKGFNNLDIYRQYLNEHDETRAIIDQASQIKDNRINNNLKAGLDYYLTKKTTLGVVFSGFSNPEDVQGSNTSFLKDPNSNVDSIVQSVSNFRNVWKNGGVNLNLRHTYDSTGRELTFDADAIGYDVSNNQRFTNTSYSPAMVKKYNDELRGDLPMKINIYSAKADYVHPLKNKAKVEAGWKSSYVITDSKAKYFNVVDNTLTPDYTKTNFFKYKENINAAYLNYNRQLSEKWGVQTGLRFENTHYSGLQSGNPTRADSSFDRTYNALFPTAYISYTADKNNQFAISAGRRIDRPAYENLNPFLFFIDRYTYGSGNPYLRPQYSTNLELSHVFKGMVTTTINYSHTKDMFSETFTQEGEYTTIQSNGNVGKKDNAGIAVSAQFSPVKWINTNIYTNYNYVIMEGLLFGDPFKVSGGSFNANFNSQFDLSKGWSAEIGGWYLSRSIEGQMLIKSLGALNTGVSKKILKEKGTLKLSARDVFYTQMARGDIHFKTTNVKFQQSRDSRVVNLTFTYRFGKPLNTPQKRERSNEEQNRVKGGQ